MSIEEGLPHTVDINEILEKTEQGDRFSHNDIVTLFNYFGTSDTLLYYLASPDGSEIYIEDEELRELYPQLLRNLQQFFSGLGLLE